MVASSNVMQFILKTHVNEIPLDQSALVALRKAVAVLTLTSNQEKFFRQTELMMHEVVCPEYDTCWQCQSRRYLVIEQGSGAPRIACSCCGHFSAMNSDEYIQPVAPSIPTRSQLARVRNAT
jgi:hypothetical protein